MVNTNLKFNNDKNLDVKNNKLLKNNQNIEISIQGDNL